MNITSYCDVEEAATAASTWKLMVNIIKGALIFISSVRKYKLSWYVCVNLGCKLRACNTNYFVRLFLVRYRVFIKYCVFSQEFSKACHLSLAITRLLLHIGCKKKLPANRNDCAHALRWELWRSLTTMLARKGLQWIEHPVACWTPLTPRSTYRSLFRVYSNVWPQCGTFCFRR